MDDRNTRSPLNQAHICARLAEEFENVGKFDEAVRLHAKIVELLEKSLEIATFDSTRQSIQLQIESHKRQETVIDLKKLQIAVNRKIKAEKAKELMMGDEMNVKKNLEQAIYKNIEAVDSLIETLAEREIRSSEENRNGGTGTFNSGVKHPKNDSTVIEELKTLNNKLRELVSQLVTQLEENQHEIITLRAEVKNYEAEKEKRRENIREQNLIDFNTLNDKITTQRRLVKLNMMIAAEAVLPEAGNKAENVDI